MLLANLLARVGRRIQCIPTRGLPRGTPKDSFDAEHGTNTSGICWWTNPRSENFARGIRYEPCSPELCRMAIECSGVDPKMFCFLDIGCGKGRPLIIASEYGFKDLLGVDYSARLCREAERNLKACGVERFRIINSDATRFDYPTVDTLAFLYHPFENDVLATVLGKLRSATLGRELVIAYVGSGSDLLLSEEWLQHIHSFPDLRLFRKSQRPESNT
jgi:SAM-dependent methyltransferase